MPEPKPLTDEELDLWERSAREHVKHALAPGILSADGDGYVDGEEVLRLIEEVRRLRGDKV